MNFYIYSPNWFKGIDSFFELLIILILIIISIYSFKTYYFSKNSNYLLLTISFVLMSISYLSKIVSNIVFISTEYQVLIYFFSLSTLLTLENISILIHKFTLIISFLVLLYISSKKQNIFPLVGISFILTLATTIINSYQLFLLIIILINVFIILNFIYFNTNTRSILPIFFILLTISYGFLFLAPILNLFYVIGEISLLFSYSVLLFSFVKIFQLK